MIFGATYTTANGSTANMQIGSASPSFVEFDGWNTTVWIECGRELICTDPEP